MTHQEYFDKLTDSIDTLSDILDTEHYGMCLVDKDGYIIKWYYEKFFNIKASAAVGRHVTEVIENTRLHVVAQTGVKELMQLQEINGSMVITNRIPLIHNHEVIGAAGTIIFRDIKEIANLHSRMSKLEDNFKAYRSEIAKMYAAQYHFDDIITNNQKMLNLKHLGQTIARSDASVLIQGESGTGKELFAQAIHNASLVSHQPFVSLNCSSIPKELLEAELFGYESGAFTGARKDGKIGKFELAGEGTLFLDELGTMPMDMQVKLLRVLESKEYVPLGSNKKVPFKARVIAWPGNVRELRNVIDRAAIICEGSEILPQHLPEYIQAYRKSSPLESSDGYYHYEIACLERQLITKALRDNGGNRQAAARQLGIHRSLLYKKMKDLGIHE